MKIERNFYLQKLIDYREDDRVKVITGIRRCGKSYLLFELFVDWLHKSGVEDDHIVSIQLDDDDHKGERRPEALSKFVKDRLPKDGMPTYVLIDEIQMCQSEDPSDPTATTFYDVLNSLVKKRGVSVYVTGSNSQMLSKDVATNFRDRGLEIRVWPLSFAEYRSARSDLDTSAAWDNYLMYGGMPRAVTAKDDEERATYLEGLFRYVYNRDIIERYNLKDDYVLDNAIRAVSSSVGSLTNPTRLADAMKTLMKVNVSAPTLSKYLGYLEDSFLLSVAHRYDVKGKRYFGYPSKYYAVDVGLRNAKLNFRQAEKTHLMENVIYTELLRRGYAVDVGEIDYAAQCAEAGLTNVVFHGSLSHAQLSDLLKDIQLHVFPSRAEGFPKVTLETAAAGVPSVVYDDYGADEWIAHGKNGFVVKTLDEMAACIQGLLDEPAKLQPMAEAARELAKSFDWKVRVKDWERVIEELAK